MFKNFLAFLIFSISASTLAAPDEINTAHENDEAAFNELKNSAEKGSIDAQVELGILFAKGQGVAQDFQRAAVWFTKAAEKGNAKAQFVLGYMSENGEGLPKDYKKAVYWYTKAANQTHAIAQYSLGVLYEFGNGVPEDNKKAFDWYSKAAAQGYAPAQTNLGQMYAYSFYGIPQDYKQAFDLYTKAAYQGDAKGQIALGGLYKDGKGTQQDYQQAYIWYSISELYGHPNAAESRDIVKQKLSPQELVELEDKIKIIINKIQNTSELPNS